MTGPLSRTALYRGDRLKRSTTPWATNPHLLLIAAFLILVLGVLILGMIVSHLFPMLLKKKGLIVGNCIMGTIFSVARG